MAYTTSEGASVRVSEYDGDPEHFETWLRFKAGEVLDTEELVALNECGAI